VTKYLVSFPSSAMQVSDEELPAVSDAAHAVMQQARDAGVYVYSGGLNEGVAPVLVGADGSTTNETYPELLLLSGGFAVLELPSRDAAIVWAARIATACRCAQELREFMVDPLS
jgi:hypothetical protein